MDSFELDDTTFDREDFSGVCRLFPIPNLVMLPHVVQPLHIFEERYREMMADAIAGDRLIAMPVLKPGWEPDYAGRPPLESYACLGKVVVHNKLPDECYNLLLLGVARVRIEHELEPLRSFRQAKVALVDDTSSLQEGTNALELKAELVAAFNTCSQRGDTIPPIEQIVQGDPSLAQLADLMAYALPLRHEQKYSLLAESSATARAHLLLKYLGRAPSSELATVAAPRGFPPPFSMN